ncbi:hypothetical protein PR202_ga24415 [Eleusine coracana subsp. coracana]|uniref:Uncharacterized protein n=1 Tax=Eleusine coracana subsp. coracana TaxID=191504 RepID=A0AAV5D8B4_ELECO|nr:hypothetical protein PR202_ga24415 [Eleusine coracana subsp. coracana]
MLPSLPSSWLVGAPEAGHHLRQVIHTEPHHPIHVCVRIRHRSSAAAVMLLERRQLSSTTLLRYPPGLSSTLENRKSWLPLTSRWKSDL